MPRFYLAFSHLLHLSFGVLTWIRCGDPPASSPILGTFKKGWMDMRRCGLSSAMLIPNYRMTWLNASSYCEGIGSHLFIMDSAEKREALRTIFERKAWALTKHYWLGLSDEYTDGQWVWLDGGELYWSGGNPTMCREFNTVLYYSAIQISQWTTEAVQKTTGSYVKSI